jgi:hypothetical protein
MIIKDICLNEEETRRLFELLKQPQTPAAPQGEPDHVETALRAQLIELVKQQLFFRICSADFPKPISQLAVDAGLSVAVTEVAIKLLHLEGLIGCSGRRYYRI